MTPALLDERPTVLVAEPIEDATRREFIVGVGAAALAAAFLAACGEEDGGGGSAPEPEATREFTDSTGTTVIVPAMPQRIVTLGPTHWAMAQVLSLGGSVVGAANFDAENWPDFITRYYDLEGVDGVGWAADTDVEAIVAQQPDLIVAPAREGALSDLVGVSPDRLTAIAPVVAIDPFRSVEEVMADYAELLGTDAAVLDGQREEFDVIVDEMRALLGERWSEVTVSSCWPREDAVESWGPLDQTINAILARLGVQWAAPSEEAEMNGGFAEFSLERLADFEADLMIYGTPNWNLDDDPVFNQLAVVQAGQVIRFPAFTFDGLHYPNLIACATYLLGELRALSQPIHADIV